MAAPGIFTSDMHEQDERWTKVDGYTQSHLHPSTRPNHAFLKKTLEHSRDRGLPDIAAQPVLGKFLALQCRFGQVTHALEVGTLGGYTSIWLASENPGLKVTTIEHKSHHAEVARENISAAGLSDQIEVIVGEGVEVLPKLLKEVEEGKRERYGFCWIDADKKNNMNYYNHAVKMGKKGMCICVDNVVRAGKLVAEGPVSETTQGARDLVESVGKDKRVEAMVMQTVAEKSYDGFLMAVVK